MAAKKFLSWLIVGVVLLIVSALVLVGTLINSKTVSSRKPEPMKENKCPIVFSKDFYGEINGKREKVVRVVFNSCKIEIEQSKKIKGFLVKINGFCRDRNCFIEVRFPIFSTLMFKHEAENLFSIESQYYRVEAFYWMGGNDDWVPLGNYTYIGKGIIR